MNTTESRYSSTRSAAITAVMVASGLLAAACGSTATASDDRAVADIPETTIAAGEAETDESADSAGSADDGTSADDEPISDEDAEAAQLRFEQCLADEGVENPFESAEDGNSAVVEFDEGEFEAFEAAQEKCEPILDEAFGSFEFTPEQEAAQADAELAFNQCMTEQGFDMSGGDDEGGFQIEGDVDIDDLNAAAEQCDDAFDEVFGDDEGSDR